VHPCNIFLSNSSSSRCGPSLFFFIGQGSFGLGSPVSSTMTTLRLLNILPARFAALISRYCRFAPVSYCYSKSLMQRFFPPEQKKSPVNLYPALSVGGFLPPEILSPHTFPYDLLYICPALGPRLRRMYLHNVHPRPLPLAKKRKPPAMIQISRLNNAAFVLAVYASQILSPRPMQDSLPVIC